MSVSIHLPPKLVGFKMFYFRSIILSFVSIYLKYDMAKIEYLEEN